MAITIECESYNVKAGPNGRLVLELAGVSDTLTTPDNLPRLDKRDVAGRLSVTVPTVERWMRAKTNPIPYRKIGKLVRFHAHEIDTWTTSGQGPASRHARGRINLLSPRKLTPN